MAQKKTPRLEGSNARSVAQKARRAKELSTISELADQNLNPTDGWRTIRPEHIEAIKTRLIGGDTLPAVCRELGINEQSVTRYMHENKEALIEYLDWKSFGTHRMWDRLIEMIDDKTMSPTDKMFAYKVISSYTGKVNRPVYGDTLNLNQNVAVSVTMPTWSVGGPVQEVIDADYTQDPDAEE